jgi:hypothetical protein
MSSSPIENGPQAPVKQRLSEIAVSDIVKCTYLFVLYTEQNLSKILMK